MTARKFPLGTQLADTFTDEQRALLRQIREEAERERPELAKMARRLKEDSAMIDAEIYRAFEMLKGLRLLQKVSLTEMAERMDLPKRDVAELEKQSPPGISMMMVVRYARALGKELRISLDDLKTTPSRQRKKAAVTA